MADSPLNNSWPSFSKLWMKRWSFKRGSEGKPCAPPAALGSGTESSSSLSPSSIAEDVFFTSLTEEKRHSSTESDYENPGQYVDSSAEDLLNLDASLRNSEFYKDLQPEPVASSQTLPTALSIVITPVGEHTLSPTLHVYQIVDQGSHPDPAAVSASYSQLPWRFSSSMEQQSSDSGEQPTVTVNTTVQLGDPMAPEAPEAPEAQDSPPDSDPDNIPMLVRSMSTSRRHSWEVPISPIDLGRRLSLDTSGIDSDGEREESILSKSTHQQHFVYPESSEDKVEHDTAGQQEEPDSTGRTPCAKADMLASDERSRAARVSRILETSSQAAKASGEEQDLEDRLQSAEGQSHLLMVQKVLQELKQYHGAKRRNRSSGERESGNVTWYEFLSNENEEEEEKTEKSEKGTKVKRTLSSLRNRMTGSFNKDRGKNREKEKEQQKEKEKEREREEKEREKMRRSSSSGHQLVPGSFSSCATCSLCSKTLQRKHGLQCLSEYHKPHANRSRRFTAAFLTPILMNLRIDGSLSKSIKAAVISVLLNN